MSINVRIYIIIYRTGRGGGSFKLTYICEYNLHFSTDVMNVHLVDVVSGGVVATIAHRRARGPINIVHSENWLVYSYFNDKVRRTEISKYL